MRHFYLFWLEYYKVEIYLIMHYWYYVLITEIEYLQLVAYEIMVSEKNDEFLNEHVCEFYLHCFQKYQAENRNLHSNKRISHCWCLKQKDNICIYWCTKCISKLFCWLMYIKLHCCRSHRSNIYFDDYIIDYVTILFTNAHYPTY